MEGLCGEFLQFSREMEPIMNTYRRLSGRDGVEDLGDLEKEFTTLVN